MSERVKKILEKRHHAYRDPQARKGVAAEAPVKPIIQKPTPPLTKIIREGGDRLLPAIAFAVAVVAASIAFAYTLFLITGPIN